MVLRVTGLTPQGLKPSLLRAFFGTTEVVPCYKAGL